MCGTRLLLLDEPFEGVAPALAQRLAEVVARPEGREGLTVLLSESDLQHSERLVDRVVSIDRGAINAMRSCWICSAEVAASRSGTARSCRR